MKKQSLKVNAVLNVCKQLCSVIFPLITIPYITRVLHAENFGKINFSNSIISYFSLIAQMGIFSYAVREGAKVRNNIEKSQVLANELFTINLLTTALSYFLLFFSILFISKLHDYTFLLIIYSCSIIFVTIGTDWINNIFEDFFYITARTIIVQIVSLILMLVFVRDENDFWVYALISVFAQGGASILNFFYVRKYIRFHPVFHCNLKKHSKPIIVLFFNSLALTIYINSDTTMLGFLIDDTAVGMYNIATKIYIVVKHIINAIFTTTLPRLSAYAEENSEKYKSLLSQVYESVITVLFPAVTGLFMTSYSIIYVLSGNEYVVAASALRILSISLGFAVLAGFFSTCVLIPNRLDKYMLYATSTAAVVNIVLNLIFIPVWSFNGAAITTIIAEIIVLGISLYYSKRIVKLHCDKKIIISIVLSCIMICIDCLIARIVTENEVLRLIISILMSSINYAIIMILFKNPLFCSMFNKLKRIIVKN